MRPRRAAKILGLEVRCDGQAVREPTWGIPLPYDPGAHDVEAVAPGHRPWSLHVDLRANAERITVSVPPLESLPDAAPLASASDASPPPTAVSSKGRTEQQVGGAILAGLGATALIGGAIAGLHAKSVYVSAVAACNGGTVCPDDHGISLRNDATTWANVSTIAFLAGGAVFVGGAVLYFTAPRDRTVTVGVAPWGAGLSVVGGF